jgi:hypothetical protein
MIGQLHLDLAGIGGWDYATRECSPIILPKGTAIWVTKGYNAGVIECAVRLGLTPQEDIIEIYLDSSKADSGFERSSEADPEDYLEDLSTFGWALRKYPR